MLSNLNILNKCFRLELNFRDIEASFTLYLFSYSIYLVFIVYCCFAVLCLFICYVCLFVYWSVLCTFVGYFSIIFLLQNRFSLLLISAFLRSMFPQQTNLILFSMPGTWCNDDILSNRKGNS